MTVERALEILEKENIDRIGIHIINSNDEETSEYSKETLEAFFTLFKCAHAIPMIKGKINDLIRKYRDCLKEVDSAYFVLKMDALMETLALIDNCLGMEVKNEPDISTILKGLSDQMSREIKAHDTGDYSDYRAGLMQARSLVNMKIKEVSEHD